MTAFTQITKTEIFAFYKQKRQQKLLKSRLNFKEIAKFMSKVLKICK